MPHLLRPAARRAAQTLAACAAVAAGAAPAAAQFAPPRPAVPAARQTAAINLIGLPFGFVSGEYERAVGTSGLAFGVGGTASFDDNDANDVFNDSYYGDDSRYRSLQAKLKYYPSARGLRGFAVGVTAGVASASGSVSRLVRVDSVPTGPSFGYVTVFDRVRRSDTRPTVGTVLDYNFLLGPRQRFLVGLGVGARRTIGNRPRETTTDFGNGVSTYYGPGLDRTLFDGRLQIGFGF